MQKTWMESMDLGQESLKLGFGGLDSFIFVWNKETRETCSIKKSIRDYRNTGVQLQQYVWQLPL